ncbi:glucose 1-dehydrogenase [Segetibacter sp. 3557_3]|uniref:SDR family NAD(P)-dependent oxidoreductase n=1 Tax=Segetibacter sp. 3557_3 TaxID=2547429 RepID=UPI00105879A1|nr:glucose 1-dehydrogenase [Segetibacter sp. 3557_3]TDH28623.1 glucose 1-dehydrogenase [Segetibacter sp. 3557_3]
MKLTNKVAIVTGGGRDIGKAVSLKLAAAGAKVVLNYFGSAESATHTVDEITSNGGEAIAVKGDMTKSEDVALLIEASKKAFGNEVHILVNVVGGLVARKTLEEMDEAFWDGVINLNLKTVFLLAKHVVPLMSKGATIVNFSSQAGRDGGGPGASAYATGKGAVTTFTRGLAKELGPKGIRVNAVCPGMIATTFHDTFTKPEVRTNVANSTPLRRQGEANEVADLVVYLASDEASFITGANIDINGGTYFS